MKNGIGIAVIAILLIGSIFYAAGGGTGFKGSFIPDTSPGTSLAAAAGACVEAQPAFTAYSSENPSWKPGVSGLWIEKYTGNSNDVYQAVVNGCGLRVVLDGASTLAFECQFIERIQTPATREKDGEQRLLCRTNSSQKFGSSVGKSYQNPNFSLGLTPSSSNAIWIDSGEGDEGYYNLGDFNKVMIYTTK